LILVGCGSFGTSEDGFIGAVSEMGDGSAVSAPASSSSSSPASSGSDVLSALVSGSVSGTGDFELFNLGAALAGDEWTVTLESTSTASGYTMVLFDADYDMLMRARVTTRASLEHILRASTDTVYLGVMPAYGSSGGQYDVQVVQAPGATVPSPRQQVVYLEFGPASGVRVHRRGAVSYDAFDATMIDPLYDGQTQLVKDTIVATMREDYAPYNVVIISSDDGPPPTDGPYSTVYFGTADDGLLGLADSVDMYNESLNEAAIVYVESFGLYRTMRLEADEMGVMIGNVASHELGHLLGLYHTKDPQEVMDSTGTAWDLAGTQTFHRGPLEDSVFATGMENTPRLLEQTVGLSGNGTQSSKLLSAAKALRYKQIRALVRQELRCRCGNCLNPDD
jgi:hypothetical protein